MDASIKKISPGIEVQVFKGLHSVIFYRIYLQHILLIRIIKVNKIQQTDIPSLVVIKHCIHQPLKVPREFRVNALIQFMLRKSYFQRIVYIYGSAFADLILPWFRFKKGRSIDMPNPL